jgi:hypothetical protein
MDDFKKYTKDINQSCDCCESNSGRKLTTPKTGYQIGDVLCYECWTWRCIIQDAKCKADMFLDANWPAE